MIEKRNILKTPIKKLILVKSILLVVAVTALSFNTSIIHTQVFANEIKVKIDGEYVSIDPSPVVADGITLVPVRTLAEKLGASVSFNDVNQQVNIKLEETTIILTIGSNIATVNGQETVLDIPAHIIDGSTFVPLGFVVEELGVQVRFVEIAYENNYLNEDKEILTLEKYREQEIYNSEVTLSKYYHIGEVATILSLVLQNEALAYIQNGNTQHMDVLSLVYVSDLGFEYLLSIFYDIEFIVKFNEIDDEISSYFLDNFYRLLMGKTTLFVDYTVLSRGITSQEIYIHELIPSLRYRHTLEHFSYYFLDFTGDGYPELGIIASSTFIIRYNPYKGIFYLWYIIDSTWSFFIGPNRMSHGGGRNPIQNLFVILNESANNEVIIHYYSEGFGLPSGEIGSINLISLPLSLNELYVPKYLKYQAITFGNNPLMYFRVTIEQFHTLRQDFDYLRNNRLPRKEFHELFELDMKDNKIIK